MLIILEGVARAGKSSIAELLLKKLDNLGLATSILKCDRGDNPYEDMVSTHLPAAYERDSVVIADRAHISELVYNSFYARTPPYPLIAMKRFDGGLSLGHTLLVYVDARTDILVARHTISSRPLEGSNEADIDTLKHLFVSEFNLSLCRKVSVTNNATEDLDAAAEKILTKFLREIFSRG